MIYDFINDCDWTNDFFGSYKELRPQAESRDGSSVSI